MTNLSYLAKSVEAGRIAAAEAQFEPLPDSFTFEDVFTVRPDSDGCFFCTFKYGWFLPTFYEHSGVAQALRLQYIKSIFRCTEQNIFILATKGSPSPETLASEIKNIMMPF